jgi:hypothetical protein
VIFFKYCDLIVQSVIVLALWQCHRMRNCQLVLIKTPKQILTHTNMILFFFITESLPKFFLCSILRDIKLCCWARCSWHPEGSWCLYLSGQAVQDICEDVLDMICMTLNFNTWQIVMRFHKRAPWFLWLFHCLCW